MSKKTQSEILDDILGQEFQSTGATTWQPIPGHPDGGTWVPIDNARLEEAGAASDKMIAAIRKYLES